MGTPVAIDVEGNGIPKVKGTPKEMPQEEKKISLETEKKLNKYPCSGQFLAASEDDSTDWIDLFDHVQEGDTEAAIQLLQTVCLHAG